MNPPKPITEVWRAERVLKAFGGGGWSVEFAFDADGRCQALDYMEGKCDEAFTAKDVEQIGGYLQVIRVSGTEGLKQRKQYENFVGDDARDAMCELKLTLNQGHRFLCFKRHSRRFVVAHGFRKPAQPETPPEAKKEARRIVAAHDERLLRPELKGKKR